MWNRFKTAWGLNNIRSHDYSPQFKPSGLVLDHIQFSYRNITGRGSKTKIGAVVNWLRHFVGFVRGNAG